MRMERNHQPEQNPEQRNKNFSEVTAPFSDKEAKLEAARCLQCKNAPCRDGCPVGVDIPAFIKAIKEDRPADAVNVIRATNNLPSVCGRVCPQESQCEKLCIRAKMEGAVAIGALERYVGDCLSDAGNTAANEKKKGGKRAAVIGSGPAGIACAGDIATAGYEVTIYEAFHEAGGVLTYGIPEFRLPKERVKKEINKVLNLGVKLELNTVVGKTITIPQLMDEYDAVFIGSGAGLPQFLGIPGEGYTGVLAANEYLTRINLMRAFMENSDTPVLRGEKVCVFGAGNVAMDAARTAKRMGAPDVRIIYRRTRDEMPARKEEVRHAEEEGISLELLTAPVEFVGDNGKLTGVKCVRCELGEPDERGRRRPVVIEGSEFVIGCDMAIVAIGTSPNPIITESFPELKTDSRGIIIVDTNMATNIDGIYAGGDATTGAATVIKAMGAGKAAARAIVERFGGKL